MSIADDPALSASAPSGQPLPHAATAETTLAALRADAHWLSAEEAAARLARHGPNSLPETRGPLPLARFARQFHDVLIYVLLASAMLALALGRVLDAGVILGVVLLNALIGVVQEGRAARALDAIRGMIDPTATVLRSGARQRVPAAAVVPGDIVLLEAGDRVPADLRLLRARQLRIDEAALTGESVPVHKNTSPVPAEAALADRASMAWSGTLVAAGSGAGVAVATGAATELGWISAMLAYVDELQTPLLRQMSGFARQVSAAVLLVSAALFGVATLIRGHPASEAFMAVIGMAVAAIPEGLPAMLTITLAIGVRQMAARQAIIRQLPAVETLGAVAVICTDKTGTLTRNEMVATTLITPANAYAASGMGHAPQGQVLKGNAVVLAADHPDLLALIRAALLCSDADLREAAGAWHVVGDPMEGALIALAHKVGLDPQAERAARTMVVNAIVAMEIAYLFSVRCLHGASLTWRGALGTPAVLIGVAVTVLAQLAFSYLPALQRPFGTAALGLAEGALVLAAGAAMLLIIEAEKRLRRNWPSAPSG